MLTGKSLTGYKFMCLQCPNRSFRNRGGLGSHYTGRHVNHFGGGQVAAYNSEEHLKICEPCKIVYILGADPSITDPHCNGACCASRVRLDTVEAMLSSSGILDNEIESSGPDDTEEGSVGDRLENLDNSYSVSDLIELLSKFQCGLYDLHFQYCHKVAQITSRLLRDFLSNAGSRDVRSNTL